MVAMAFGQTIDQSAVAKSWFGMLMEASTANHLRFGHIVASEMEVPNMLVNLV